MEDYKQVDIVNYTKELLDEELINLEEVQKSSRIKAREGIVGEEIVTILEDGHEETHNIVKVDEQGKVDMIVTNPGGEEYIVPFQKFIEKYEIDSENPEYFKPKGGRMLSYQTFENLSFTAPWGQDMFVKKGSYIMINPNDFNDMYGIGKVEYFETYEPISDQKTR